MKLFSNKLYTLGGLGLFVWVLAYLLNQLIVSGTISKFIGIPVAIIIFLINGLAIFFSYANLRTCKKYPECVEEDALDPENTMIAYTVILILLSINLMVIGYIVFS